MTKSPLVSQEDRELLPCPSPWCGAQERRGDFGPAVRLHHFGNYRVVCTSCVLEGPLRPTEAEAISAWNTRPSSTGGEIERLLDLHEKMMKAVEHGRPYPVSIACGQSDLDAVLFAACEIERLKAALSTSLPPIPEGLRELSEQATAGEWEVERSVMGCRSIVRDEELIASVEDAPATANAPFITELVNWFREQLAREGRGS